MLSNSPPCGPIGYPLCFGSPWFSPLVRGRFLSGQCLMLMLLTIHSRVANAKEKQRPYIEHHPFVFRSTSNSININSVVLFTRYLFHPLLISLLLLGASGNIDPVRAAVYQPVERSGRVLCGQEQPKQVPHIGGFGMERAEWQKKRRGRVALGLAISYLRQMGHDLQIDHIYPTCRYEICCAGSVQYRCRPGNVSYRSCIFSGSDPSA